MILSFFYFEKLKEVGRMATRSLVVIQNKEEERGIVLYKHYDGYTEYMKDYIKEFAKWFQEEVNKCEGFQHFLFQDTEVSAALIVFDYLQLEKEREKFKMHIRPTPDIRPTPFSTERALKEEIMWEEYTYHIILDPENKKWIINIYETKNIPNNQKKLIETFEISF